jgi:hypothetical protein
LSFLLFQHVAKLSQTMLTPLICALLLASNAASVSHDVATAGSGRSANQAGAALPEWARSRWEVLAQTRQLKRSSHLKITMISGRFDTDTTTDIALLVEHQTTHKIGIAFIHRGATPVSVVGAGKDFGNGGDNFDWMDNWRLEPRTKARRVDAVFVEKSESASALIYLVNDKYVWRQAGD